MMTMINKQIKHNFLMNYIIIMALSVLMLFIFLSIISFVSYHFEADLYKNTYTAENLSKDNNLTSEIIEKGGGVLIVGSDLKIISKKGISLTDHGSFTMNTWTEFLTSLNHANQTFGFTTYFDDQKDQWFIVGFPTSIRVNLNIVMNQNYESLEKDKVSGVFLSAIILYFILMYIVTVLFSKYTSKVFVNPLEKLILQVEQLKNGNYKGRIESNRKDEIGQLVHVFNDMAEKIDQEITGKRNLILDISHDIKNPLATIQGYCEYNLSQEEISIEDLKESMLLIEKSSKRANRLVQDLFELSQIESAQFKVNKTLIDFSEWLRSILGEWLPKIEKQCGGYDFLIPEGPIHGYMDEKLMTRAFENLIENAMIHNEEGFKLEVSLQVIENHVCIKVSDNGKGISNDLKEHIFEPFVKDESLKIYNTGLGLAIVKKVILAHNGSIEVLSDLGKGSRFIIKLPYGI
jgi:signal transduction histidine kinase